MKSMGAFIKVHFKTHKRLDECLRLGQNTVSRWYNKDPKKFFMYLPELQKWSNEPVQDIISMIQQRQLDVEEMKKKNVVQS